MKNTGQKFITTLGVMFLTVLFASLATADVLNGDFEEYDVGVDFNTPADWNALNYAAVVEKFFPNPEDGRTKWKNDIDVNGLDPYEGNSFVVLSTGDIEPDPWYAQITQEIQVNPEETLYGMYFFGTCDYIDYDDYAEIILEPDSNDPNFNVLRISVQDVGDYSSTPGWVPFSSEPNEIAAGNYTLKISVNDVGDPVFPIYKSYFAVDGLKLCVRPDGGDINNDCKVNFKDLSLLGSYWLEDCNDPDWCQGADTDQSGVVDMNDLSEITDYWLDGA